MFNTANVKDRLSLTLTKLAHRAEKVEFVTIGAPGYEQRVKMITPRPK